MTISKEPVRAQRLMAEEPVSKVRRPPVQQHPVDKPNALKVTTSEERAEVAPEGQNQRPNRRNGNSQKTVNTDARKVLLDIPRDRNGTFDPLLIGSCFNQPRRPGWSGMAENESPRSGPTEKTTFSPTSRQTSSLSGSEANSTMRYSALD